MQLMALQHTATHCNTLRAVPLFVSCISDSCIYEWCNATLQHFLQAAHVYVNVRVYIYINVGVCKYVHIYPNYLSPILRTAYTDLNIYTLGSGADDTNKLYVYISKYLYANICIRWYKNLYLNACQFSYVYTCVHVYIPMCIYLCITTHVFLYVIRSVQI